VSSELSERPRHEMLETPARVGIGTSLEFRRKLHRSTSKYFYLQSPGKKLLITGIIYDILCKFLCFSHFLHRGVGVFPVGTRSRRRSAIVLVRSWTKNSLMSWGLGFVAGNVKVTATVKVKQSPMAKRNGRKGFGSNRYSGY
jgi:hypothetical protein